MISKEEINKNIKEENNEVKKSIENIEQENDGKLPKELIEKGWILKDYEILIPYGKNIYWCCRVNPEIKEDKRKKKWIISWRVYDETQFHSLGEEFYSNVFINRVEAGGDKEIGNRNKIMGYVTAKEDLPRGFGEVKEYWADKVELLNKYQIEGTLKNVFDNTSDEPEEEEEEEYPYKTFEDYPENVQKEALKIIEKGNIINEMLRACNITHMGDVKTLKLLYLSYQSLFIKEPVHQVLGGRTGEGKTDTVETSVATIPDRYVFRFRNQSPKYIHYSCENFNSDYNILLNDDFKAGKAGSEMYELNKSITDPNDREKKHQTVVDSKAVTFALLGEYLGIYNLAKPIEDEEFLNRLFINDVSEDDSKLDLKEKIKENENLGTKDSGLLESMRFILKAVWQYHIDKEIKVFNPYIIFLDVSDKNNRNVSSLTKFIKANSFFKYSEREKINDNVIGSLEDLKEVLELWEDKSLVQNYKLDPKQVEILKMLEYYEEEDIARIKETHKNRNLLNEDSTDISELNNVNTITQISNKLRITPSSLGRLLNGSESGTQPGLINMGLVKKFYLNDTNIREGAIIYINPEHENNVEGLKNGLDLNHLNQILDKYKFNTLKRKKRLVYNFLLYNQIIINDMEEYKINEFLEKLSYKVNTYQDVIKLLNEIKQMLSDKFSENRDFSNTFYEEVDNMFNIFHRNTNFGEEKKTDNNTSNDDNLNINPYPDHINNMVKGYKRYEDTTINIQNEVLKSLVKQGSLSSNGFINLISLYKLKDEKNSYLSKASKKLLNEKNISKHGVKFTIKKSIGLLPKRIYESLSSGNRLTKKKLGNIIHYIYFNYGNSKNKLRKVENLVENESLFIDNNKISITDNSEEIYEGGSL